MLLPIGTAIAGYFGGLVNDALKNRIDTWLRKRPLIKKLYGELAHNYSALVFFLLPEKLAILEQQFAENIKTTARTPVYDYARTQQELCFHIEEWDAFVEINESLKRLLRKNFDSASYTQMGVSYAAQLGKNLISLIEETILGGSLNMRQFSKVTPDITGRLLEIKKGKRKKSSEIYEAIESKALDDLIELMKLPDSEPPKLS